MYIGTFRKLANLNPKSSWYSVQSTQLRHFYGLCGPLDMVPAIRWYPCKHSHWAASPQDCLFFCRLHQRRYFSSAVVLGVPCTMSQSVEFMHSSRQRIYYIYIYIYIYTVYLYISYIYTQRLFSITFTFPTALQNCSRQSVLNHTACDQRVVWV